MRMPHGRAAGSLQDALLRLHTRATASWQIRGLIAPQERSGWQRSRKNACGYPPSTTSPHPQHPGPASRVNDLSTTAAVPSSREDPTGPPPPPARSSGRGLHGVGEALPPTRATRWTSAATRPDERLASPATAPPPHPSPPLRSPPLSAPQSPVAERQVPASRAPQAPQHRVQRRWLRPARPLAGRERSAGEFPRRLQPALLLGRSRGTGLQRRAAGRTRSPPRVTHRRAGLRHGGARPG